MEKEAFLPIDAVKQGAVVALVVERRSEQGLHMVFCLWLSVQNFQSEFLDVQRGTIRICSRMDINCRRPHMKSYLLVSLMSLS